MPCTFSRNGPRALAPFSASDPRIAHGPSRRAGTTGTRRGGPCGYMYRVREESLMLVRNVLVNGVKPYRAWGVYHGVPGSRKCIAEPLGPRSGRAVRTARRGVKSSRGGARGAGRASRRGVPARFRLRGSAFPPAPRAARPAGFPRRDATWTITRARSLSCAVPVAGSGAGAGRAWAVRGRSEGAGSRGSRCRVSDRNRVPRRAPARRSRV